MHAKVPTVVINWKKEHGCLIFSKCPPRLVSKTLHGCLVFMKCPPRLIKMQAKPSYWMFIVNGFGNRIPRYVEK